MGYIRAREVFWGMIKTYIQFELSAQIYKTIVVGLLILTTKYFCGVSQK